MHFVEAKGSQVLNDHLRQLYKDKQRDESPYLVINILAFSEEQKEHKFEDWGKYPIPQTGLEIEEVDITEDQKTEKLWIAYQAFLQGGELYMKLVGEGEKNQRTLLKESTR